MSTYTHYKHVDVDRGIISIPERSDWLRLDHADEDGTSVRLTAVEETTVRGWGDATALGRIDYYDEQGERMGFLGATALLR